MAHSVTQVVFSRKDIDVLQGGCGGLERNVKKYGLGVKKY
jgi:hypothetical protein